MQGCLLNIILSVDSMKRKDLNKSLTSCLCCIMKRSISFTISGLSWGPFSHQNGSTSRWINLRSNMQHVHALLIDNIHIKISEDELFKNMFIFTLNCSFQQRPLILNIVVIRKLFDHLLDRFVFAFDCCLYWCPLEAIFYIHIGSFAEQIIEALVITWLSCSMARRLQDWFLLLSRVDDLGIDICAFLDKCLKAFKATVFGGKINGLYSLIISLMYWGLSL